MARHVITVEDPNSSDVAAILEAHLAMARDASPPEDVHALGPEGLSGPGVAFYGLRIDGRLAAVGALRELDAGHAEIKSMHTASWARGRGYGRQMLDHLLEHARSAGFGRVSLETGTMDEFAAARALYVSAGFEVCEPFGDYFHSPNSVCMTLVLGPV